jgi:hypothetical protein
LIELNQVCIKIVHFLVIAASTIVDLDTSLHLIL